MTPPTTELATVQATVGIVGAIANTTAAIVSQLRVNHVARIEDIRRLQNNLAALRRREIADYLADLGVVNMNHMFDLYDLANSHANNITQHVNALEIAGQVTRKLRDNLERLAQDLR